MAGKLQGFAVMLYQFPSSDDRDKRNSLNALIDQHKWAVVLIDSRVAGVVLPESVINKSDRTWSVRLRVNSSFVVTHNGVSSSHVWVPWSAIYAIATNESDPVVWEADVPTEFNEAV